MAQALLTLIPWLVLPIVIIALLIFSMTIFRRVKEPEPKLSARAGFWAGFILFVIFIVSQLRDVREPCFDFSSVPGFDFLPLIAGCLIGFALLWAIRITLSTRFVGVITLLLTAASTSALYSFIFIESLRATVLYASLGVALGILVHVVLLPSSIRTLGQPAANRTIAKVEPRADEVVRTN